MKTPGEPGVLLLRMQRELCVVAISPVVVDVSSAAGGASQHRRANGRSEPLSRQQASVSSMSASYYKRRRSFCSKGPRRYIGVGRGWAKKAPVTHDSQVTRIAFGARFFCPAEQNRAIGACATITEPKSGSYPVAGSASMGLDGPNVGAILSLT